MKKIVSLFLAMGMILSLLSITALAYGPFDQVPLQLRISSYGAPFLNGDTQEHTEYSYTRTEYIKRTDACSGEDSTAEFSAYAYFVGSNQTGWTLYVDITVGNYKNTWKTNAKITNKDMSNATGDITGGISWNTSRGVSTSLSISGAASLPVSEPDKPSDTDVTALLNQAVQVTCVNSQAQHTSSTHDLLDGSFTIGEVTGDSSSGYFCDVTVTAEKYVEAYTTDSRAAHTLEADEPNSKTIQLAWNSGKWEAAAALPIQFETVCLDISSPPTVDEWENVFLQIQVGRLGVENYIKMIRIDASTFETFRNSVSFAEPVYDEGTGTWTMDVTVEGYSPDGTKTTHMVNSVLDMTSYEGWGLAPDEQATKTITLTYIEKDNGWYAADGTVAKLRFDVAPQTPDTSTLENLLNGKITVACTTDGPDHSNGTYGLIAGGYTSGTVSGNFSDGYFYTIALDASAYAAQYDIDKGYASGTHTATSDDVTISFKWNTSSKVWETQTSLPVTIAAECTVSAYTYTLTYDANAQGGTVSGMPTPNPVTDLSDGSYALSTSKPAHTAADGINVVFIGWTETPATQIFSKNDSAPATVDSITIDGSNKTVYAAWGYDVNNNGTPDVQETKYTLTYHANDGTGATTQETYVAGEQVQLPEATRTSDWVYRFLGWKDGEQNLYEAGTAYTITGDAELFATWRLASVDGDGEWTYLDAMCIMDYLAGKIELTDEQLEVADRDEDGFISYLDAMFIMDSLAGIL